MEAWDQQLYELKALVITSQRFNREADLPTSPAYTLKPGRPAPGLPTLLRHPIAVIRGTGILTCFPSTTALALALGAD